MYSRKAIVLTFILLFVLIFSNNSAMEMSKKFLPGKTEVEKTIVQNLQQGKKITEECINALITEEKENLINYIEKIILASEDNELYIFGDVNLKDNLISAVNNFNTIINDKDFRLK